MVDPPVGRYHLYFTTEIFPPKSYPWKKPYSYTVHTPYMPVYEHSYFKEGDFGHIFCVYIWEDTVSIVGMSVGTPYMNVIL